MRFLITRTSDFWGIEKNKPCEEAVKRQVIYNNEKRTRWCVEINNLDELLAFNKKYGDLILSRTESEPSYPEIEIYDDYREG